MTKIKICGIKRLSDIHLANELSLDYVGFVFAKSRRNITQHEAFTLKSNLNPSVKAVGVFVNHPVNEIIDCVANGIIDCVQLHGDETEADVVRIKHQCPKAEVFKAINVQTANDIVAWKDSCADFLLLDNGKGGTGISFDWAILKNIANFPKPYFIAGGLNPHNVKDVLSYNPFGVDVSGGVETDNQKDTHKIKQFVKEVRT